MDSDKSSLLIIAIVAIVGIASLVLFTGRSGSAPVIYSSAETLGGEATAYLGGDSYDGGPCPDTNAFVYDLADSSAAMACSSPAEAGDPCQYDRNEAIANAKESIKGGVCTRVTGIGLRNRDDGAVVATRYRYCSCR